MKTAKQINAGIIGEHSFKPTLAEVKQGVAQLQPLPGASFKPDESPDFQKPTSFQLATGTELEVIKEICRRQQAGIQKYGTTVANNHLKLRAWLQHAYEEALDQAIYLKRAIEEIDRNNPSK